MDYLAKRSISCAELARRSTKILELLFDHLMPCPRNKHIFRCDQNGPPARREEGAYPERDVTDEQRSRRPIFIATLRAAASWLFFRVARSSRPAPVSRWRNGHRSVAKQNWCGMLVATASPVRTALKSSQLTPRPRGERHAYFGDRTPGPPANRPSRAKLKIRIWATPSERLIPSLCWILTSCFLAAAESEQPAAPALSEDAKSSVERGIMEFRD